MLCLSDGEDGLMARRKPTGGPRSVVRTDLLSANITAAREAQVRTVLTTYPHGHAGCRAMAAVLRGWPVQQEP